jgi:hypothetical protein
VPSIWYLPEQLWERNSDSSEHGRNIPAVQPLPQVSDLEFGSRHCEGLTQQANVPYRPESSWAKARGEYGNDKLQVDQEGLRTYCHGMSDSRYLWSQVVSAVLAVLALVWIGLGVWIISKTNDQYFVSGVGFDRSTVELIEVGFTALGAALLGFLACVLQLLMGIWEEVTSDDEA